MSRASTSSAPPGLEATTKRTGRSGNAAATAATLESASTPTHVPTIATRTHASHRVIAIPSLNQVNGNSNFNSADAPRNDCRGRRGACAFRTGQTASDSPGTRSEVTGGALQTSANVTLSGA